MENELYDEYLANPEAFVRQGFEAEVEEIKNVNVGTEQMSGKVFDATKNYETAQQVKELSGWQEIKEAKIRLSLAQRYYKTWLPQQLMNADISDTSHPWCCDLPGTLCLYERVWSTWLLKRPPRY